MERNMRKSGFSAVEVIIVIVVVGIVTTLGIVGYNRWAETKVNRTTANNSQDTVSAPEIKKASDLDTAATTLDAVNFGDSDATELDAQSGTF